MERWIQFLRQLTEPLGPPESAEVDDSATHYPYHRHTWTWTRNGRLISITASTLLAASHELFDTTTRRIIAEIVVSFTPNAQDRFGVVLKEHTSTAYREGSCVLDKSAPDIARHKCSELVRLFPQAVDSWDLLHDTQARYLLTELVALFMNIPQK